MPTKTISLQFKVAGVLTDVDSMTFSDAAENFGVQDITDDSGVVDAGTAFTHDGTGLYSYEITGLVTGHDYKYWIRRDYNGIIKIVEKTFTAGLGGDASGYYADQDDVEDVFGVENVARWSQLDNEVSTAD